MNSQDSTRILDLRNDVNLNARMIASMVVAGQTVPESLIDDYRAGRDELRALIGYSPRPVAS